MTFDDLSLAQQTKLLDKYRDVNVDYDWWDCAYESIDGDAQLVGIMINTDKSKRPDISFSGFWSQGDGASFNGRFELARMGAAMQNMTAHGVPHDSPLYEVALLAQEIANEWQIITTRERLAGSDMDFDLDPWPSIDSSDRGFSVEVNTSDDTPIIELEDMLQQLAEDFAGYIYRTLEAEYEYLTSDEAVKEYIESHVDLDEEVEA